MLESTRTKSKLLRADGGGEIIVDAVRANVLSQIGDPSFGEYTLQVSLEVRFAVGDVHPVWAGSHSRCVRRVALVPRIPAQIVPVREVRGQDNLLLRQKRYFVADPVVAVTASAAG